LLDYVFEVENRVDKVLKVVPDFPDKGLEVFILKEEVFILVKEVVDIHTIVVHGDVLDDDLFVQDLGKDKEDEDARQREKGHVSLEHELVIKNEVGKVHSHIKDAEREESLVLTQLIKLKNFF
jgi:hypothetical protein